MKFEKMTIDHINELCTLYIKAFNAEPWNDKWTINSANKRLSQMIQCIGYEGMVCYDNNKIIGMILGQFEEYYDGIYFEIKEFCVDVNKKGNGIGSLLLEKFLQELKNSNVRKVFLSTLRASKTQGFYKKNKFKINNNMIIMNRELSLL